VDADTEKPIPNAGIFIQRSTDGGWETIGETRTDGHGRFKVKLKVEKAGRFRYRAVFPGGAY